MSARPSWVNLKPEEEEGELRRDGAAPGSARVPASEPRTALAALPAPALHHDAPAAGGAGSSEVTLVKVEEAEETLGRQRGRRTLGIAHGPVRVDAHIKVEDSASGEDTDEDGGI
jgi:hypothetical protein